MKKLVKKAQGLALRARYAVQDFLRGEQGDTNFISIAIVLVVVLLIAVVFIAFGQDILDRFNNSKNDLLNSLDNLHT